MSAALRRVYLAVGVAGLDALAVEAVVSAPAYAVTAAVRAVDPGADEEELEYEALTVASASPEATAGGARIVVAAADLPERLVQDAPDVGDGYGVRVAEVALSAVVAFHVGDAVDAHRGSGEVNDAAEAELSWYDVTELDAVRAEAR